MFKTKLPCDRVYQNNLILWNTFLRLPCTASMSGVFPFAYWALILVHGRANNSCALSTLPGYHENKLKWYLGDQIGEFHTVGDWYLTENNYL